MKRKYAAIVLSMAMVLSPVSAFAADTTADAATTAEADATEDEGTTEVSEYIIGQVTKVSDSSIEVKTGEILKEESEEKTENTEAAKADDADTDSKDDADTDSKDDADATEDTAKDEVNAGTEEVTEESESISLKLEDETQTYDIGEDTPLYSAAGHNKLEVLAAGKEADDAAADEADSKDEADADSKDKADSKADADADSKDKADSKADADTEENADTTSDTDAKDDVYEMVVGGDAVISTIKLSDIKEGDVVILKLDQDGKVESATVLSEATDAEETTSEN